MVQRLWRDEIRTQLGLPFSRLSNNIHLLSVRSVPSGALLHVSYDDLFSSWSRSQVWSFHNEKARRLSGAICQEKPLAVLDLPIPQLYQPSEKYLQRFIQSLTPPWSVVRHPGFSLSVSIVSTYLAISEQDIRAGASREKGGVSVSCKVSWP